MTKSLWEEYMDDCEMSPEGWEMTYEQFVEMKRRLDNSNPK